MLTDEQKNVVDLMLSNESDYNIVSVDSVAGSGKGLLDTTRLFTNRGIIPIKYLTTEDKVLGTKGKLVGVKGVYHRGMQECYLVRFSNNTQVICDKDHLWGFYTKHGNNMFYYNVYDTQYIYNNYNNTELALPLYMPFDDNKSIKTENSSTLIKVLLNMYACVKHDPNYRYCNDIFLESSIILGQIELMDTFFDFNEKEECFEYKTKDYSIAKDLKNVSDLAGFTTKITYEDNIYVIKARNTAMYITGIEKLSTKYNTVCIKVDSEDELFVIEGGIVTHNTTVTEHIVDELKPNNGLYTAFNKGIVEEGVKRFDNKIKSKTLHSLAYSYVKPDNISNFTYSDIVENISYPNKSLVINLLDTFYRSEFLELDDFFEGKETITNSTKELVNKYYNLMLEDSIPVTFNFLLKKFHKLLHSNIYNVDLDLLILDECLTEDHLIDTSTGNKSIKNICNSLKNNKEVYVKSYNIEKDVYEYKKAKNPLISNNREVLEIKTEGLNVLKCTPNHKILTNRGYIRADELKVGEDILLLDDFNKQKTKYMLNNDQLQVILGGYLGDGGLRQQSKYNTYRINFTQKEEHYAYLKYKADCLNINTIKTIKSGYTGKYSIKQSNYSKVFILEDNPFNLVLNKLDALGLAIWFMDDGSNRTIHTEGFTYEENIQLQELLSKRFQISTEIKKDKKGYYYLYVTNEKRLYEVIKDYLRPEFLYKFSEALVKNYTHKNYILNNKFKNYGGNIVTSVKKEEGLYTVYDFEVEDNHNFLVSKSYNGSKIIVHNCQDTTNVTLEIFKLINSKKKIILGDKYQNIYDFLDTVNAFELLDNTIEKRLTKSFRCSPEIAEQVELFGKQCLSKDFKFTGTENIANYNTTSYLSAYNATCLYAINELIDSNKKFTTMNRINNIFSMPIAIKDIIDGKPILDKEYRYIEKEYIKWKESEDSKNGNFYSYLVSLGIDEVASCLNLVNDLSKKGVNLYKLKHKLDNYPQSDNNIVSTIHSFKGLETDTVVLSRDIVDLVNTARLDSLVSTCSSCSCSNKKNKQILNLYYVALTRAKHNIEYAGE